MKIICGTQRTPEWYAARRGRITASEIQNVLAGVGTKSRDGYALRLVLDLEGVPDMTDSDPPPWFLQGILHEGWVVGWYEWERNTTITRTGFVVHDIYDWLGCSPDGFVGEDGMIECKYRTSLAQYYAATRRTTQHKQIQMQLMVTGRAWCDEVNYWRTFADDGTIARELGCIRRHYPERVYQGWMEEKLLAFRGSVLRLFQSRQATTHD